MKVTIRLFSVAKDLAGFREREIELPDPSNVSDVMTMLDGVDSRFADWRKVFRLAVNQEYVSEDHPLENGDEVAVIPPVSGG
jgi:molybdopterin synthase sulfur carrier subunit